MDLNTTNSENTNRVDDAIEIYKTGKMSICQASKIAGVTQERFREILEDKKIPIHYDIENNNETTTIS
jgi:predicted HTH domain antitoxin